MGMDICRTDDIHIDLSCLLQEIYPIARKHEFLIWRSEEGIDREETSCWCNSSWLIIWISFLGFTFSFWRNIVFMAVEIQSIGVGNLTYFLIFKTCFFFFLWTAHLRWFLCMRCIYICIKHLRKFFTINNQIFSSAGFLEVLVIHIYNFTLVTSLKQDHAMCLCWIQFLLRRLCCL